MATSESSTCRASMSGVRSHVPLTLAACTLVLLVVPSSASACPRRSKRAAPAIAVYQSLAAAEKALRLHPSDKLADHVEGAAFAVSSFKAGRSEGDRGDYAPNAVFLVGKKVVVARKLATNTSAMPQDSCMQVNQHHVLALRVVGEKGGIGHFRVLREGVDGTPTLPARTSGRCTERIKYRIEDHFIDLVRGRYLAVYDQVFEDTTDVSSESLPGIAFDEFTMAADGRIMPKGCKAE
jgi:hypothetical protein